MLCQWDSPKPSQTLWECTSKTLVFILLIIFINLLGELGLNFCRVHENSRPVTENMTSPTVMKKYCGIWRAMCTELGLMSSVTVMES
ncbi:hypothetical protein EYF80_046194 [Liparis tanakae]|uniref:Uncharacterized protein n=1 Tax=Liparis tanakae TaxID=230148 RepID=A0A4Z2FRJ5_9TELE|nr:hypothetical protein EYF80_046194 [Liparis tanakae]